MSRISRKEMFAHSKYFHILTEGLSQLEIFDKPNLKNFYLNSLQEKANDLKISILAYCIMDNHSHIILTADDNSKIPEFMRRLNTVYAKFYNRIKGRSGYVFNGRYESDNLDDNKQILAAIYFVHNNPIKAGIVNNSSDYEFSSAKSFLDEKGIVDFKKLHEIFEQTPELSNFKNNTKIKFKEAKPSEDCDSVLIDLVKRYNIEDMKDLQDPELLKIFIYELQTRSGVSLRDVAYLLDFDREKVRRTAKKINFDY